MSFSEFRKKQNRLTLQDIRLLIVAGVVIIVIVGALVSLSSYLVYILPEGGEFWLLRESGQAFLFNRVEPYSGLVPAEVQMQVYGRAAQPGEEPYILDIPFHLLILYFPLALFPDDLIARIVWMSLLLSSITLLTIFSFQLTDWHPPWMFRVLFYFFGLLSFYGFTAILEGAPVVLLGLAYAGILLSLKRNMDELMGALLALSAFQWEVGGLFILFIFWWIIINRRWRVLAGFGMLLFILGVISILWYPGWIWPFLRASWNNLKTPFGFSTYNILTQFWPDFGRQLFWVLLAMAILVLGIEWRASRKTSFRHMYWTACLSIAFMPLLGTRSEMENLLVLVTPFALIYSVLFERWKSAGRIVSPIILLLTLAVPWNVFTTETPLFGNMTENFLYLFYPVMAVLGLYWTRWWAIRPPRTWLDTVK